MAEQLSYCAGLVRTHDHDRFLSALFAPADMRENLWALYAFNIEIARIADMVSEPLLGEIRLQWWREGIEAVYAGQAARAHPVLQALAQAIKACELPHAAFDRLMDAHAADFAPIPHATMAALEDNIDAASTGLLRLAAAVTGSSAQNSVLGHSGMALGLTGLLRNFARHLARGHICLPASVMQAGDLKPENILKRQDGPELRRVVQHIADKAAQHLSQARCSLPRPERQLLPALLPVSMTDMYLRQIYGPAYTPFRELEPVPAFRRQIRMVRVILLRRL